MKTIQTWLTMIALLLCSITMSAQTFQVDGLRYTVLSSTDMTVSVQQGSATPSGELIIPTTVTYEGTTYDVISIGSSAFSGCTNLTSITIPKGVNSIGNNAFKSCSGLIFITLPEGVTSIGSCAFQGCSGLTSITLPESLTEIKNYTFTYCIALESIFIPESVTSIGDYAFVCCESLTSITIPNSVVKIGSNAFWNYNNTPKLTSVTIGSGVKEIGYDAFSCHTIKKVNIENLSAWCNINFVNSLANPIFYAEKFYVDGELVKDLIIPDDVTSISPYAFYYCKAVTNVTISGTVSSIGKYAFCYSGVKNLSLNEGLEAIEEGAFKSTLLTDITIPEGVTTIGTEAFSGSTSATSITLPNTLTTVGKDAFRSLSSLEQINISDLGAWCGIDFANSYANPMSGLSYGDKIYLNGVSISELELPTGIRFIGNYAFYGAGDIFGGYGAHLIIPDGVESIGEEAFYGFYRYNSITLPNSLSSIGTGAFRNCSALRSVSFPENMTSISPSLLLGCNSIEEVYLPDGITSIGDDAFSYCYGLTSITLPASLASLGKSVFSHCSRLTSIISLATTPPKCTTYETFAEMSPDATVYVPVSSVNKYASAYGWSLLDNFIAIAQILDSQENYTQSEAQDCSLLTYTRTFNNTNWQALYVPFEIPVTEEFLANFEVADLNDVRQYDRDDDGVKDETVIEAFKVTSGTLAANYPYLIRAREAGEKTITVTDATLYATEENSIDCSSVHEKFTFTGTYSRLSSEELPQGEGYYALSGGVWQPVAEGASLGAFRFYLKVDSRNSLNATQGNAIRMRIIGEDGEEDDATRIDTPEFKTQKSELIFDLQGRRVENPTKGVYIVNGVKRVF